MKILTLMGTRPEIIRLSRVTAKLEELCDHVIVHTGQNYDPQLRDVFMDELGMPRPEYALDCAGPFGGQVGAILTGMERILLEEKPDAVLVLGDTNSALGAIGAKRIGIPVFHMEAGNRCYDDRVPEEVNRRIIDHSSDILMPYTERSRQNLLREGISGTRIYVTGNPIHEVIRHFEPKIRQSTILDTLGVPADGYFLVTMHRAENVDVESRLRSLTEALCVLHEQYGLPVIVSTHPRTRARMASFGVDPKDEQVRFLEPFGFFDFITLERNARCVLSDSGTVQEECCIFLRPNVTLRDVTERPETIECGSNILSGAECDSVLRCVKMAIEQHGAWKPPPEYVVENVSNTVARIVLGYNHVAAAKAAAQ